MEIESDAQLMARVAQGERAPLGELYLRYGRQVERAVTRWLPAGAAADAEDLVQEIFMTLVDSAKKYKETGRFRAWLYAIAYRQSMYMGRSQRNRSQNMEKNRQTIKRTIGPVPEVSHDIRSEQRGVIRQILEQLPAELREVLVLKTVEGFTATEIGRITGVAEATARTRLHRARKEVLARTNEAKRNELLQGGVA